MSIRRRDYQFRLVWRRQGDRVDRKRVFDTPSATYKFIIRLCGEQPWQGSTHLGLRQLWAIVAKRLNTPTTVQFEHSTREVAVLLQSLNKKILWLRIETRQVAAWSEMLNPMEVLQPKAWERIAARADTYCDELDAHPEKRWVPASEVKTYE